MSLVMKYFVLKPRAKERDDQFALASQEAMLKFAAVIENDDQALSDALRRWVYEEKVKQTCLPK